MVGCRQMMPEILRGNCIFAKFEPRATVRSHGVTVVN